MEYLAGWVFVGVIALVVVGGLCLLMGDSDIDI